MSLVTSSGLREKPRKVLPNYSPKINQQKKQKLDLAREIISNSKLVVFTLYQKPNISLKAWELVKYNMAIEEAGGDIKVIKNSLLKIALEEKNYNELVPKIRGAIIVNYTQKDPIALAKKLDEIITTIKKEKNVKEDIPEILFGILEGKVITSQEVKQLSKIPPKEVLLSQLAGTLKAPISKLASTLNTIILKLLWALQAVKEKKS
ncbi:MAG: 50S ribosomal protein L10 [Candidatus Calescibacterium sp.]|nr:50S ribosomal protein L10 [Candidatus Calescibacterium sp.]MCX7972726.1 50S ribosomal protein L10 [bacterium]MDW8195530.1 50S ribosomal protein L10 [Candidatus Calescibacterium sp.]